MKLSIDQLRSFIYVAKFKSFSQAARELKKAQSVVSTHVSSLEDELDYTLFKRGHKIELTARGRALFAYAKEIVESAYIFETRALSLHNIKNPTINLGIDYSIYDSGLFNILSDFSKKYPQLTLNLTLLSAFDVGVSMSEANIDIALIFNQNLPETFNVIKIMDIENKVITSRCHELVKCKKITRDVLSKYRQIVITSQFSKDLKPIVLSPTHYQVDNYIYALSMVQKKIGFAVVPSLLVDLDADFLHDLVYLDDTHLNFNDSSLSIVFRNHALDFEPISFLAKEFQKHFIKYANKDNKV